MYCTLFSNLLVLILIKLHEIDACGPPPSVPYVDTNQSVPKYAYPGTVLHFRCKNSTSSPEFHEEMAVRMVCLSNNTWAIHGASRCESEKCYIAFAIFLTASVIAVSATLTYIASMVIIWIMNRKSRYQKLNKDAADDLYRKEPLKINI
ncbi:uncharacterized protein LOC133196361 [Saccostrea echinata]|uniref:uncharacterized protein LOC133196361 n=1 Tax=Saccostrea echinata TaxID=191078 RepID=UPI002A80A356|nr:uncharacterized protein LOC133196361 [Saccostrea echinata]